MDTGLILEEMIPPDTGILFQYINYLTQRERIDEAGQVWATQQRKFQTGADTLLLVVRVVRPHSRKLDNQTSGTRPGSTGSALPAWNSPWLGPEHLDAEYPRQDQDDG